MWLCGTLLYHATAFVLRALDEKRDGAKGQPHAQAIGAFVPVHVYYTMFTCLKRTCYGDRTNHLA